MIVVQPIEFFQYGPDISNELIPALTSISPNSGVQGSVVNATVKGTNFAFATGFSLGSGIVVSSVVIVNGTTATMTLTISPTALLGAHDLTVTGPAGSTILAGAFNVLPTVVLGTGDFFDYIFQFANQGSFLRDPTIQQFVPQVSGSQPGVQLLIYNPVETLQKPTPTSGNALVLPPQLAQSTVALPGFWAMLTIQSSVPIPQFITHPNLQILSDRTFMFNRKPSVMINKIDVSHINIIINIFGVYVTDGMIVIPSGLQSEPVPIVFG